MSPLTVFDLGAREPPGLDGHASETPLTLSAPSTSVTSTAPRSPC